MSLELRIEDDEFVCDWGNFPYSNPRPERGEVGPLMLVTREYVDELLDGPVKYGPSVHSVTVDGVRTFAHVNYFGKHWTWELFESHWWDGQGPEILVGRWPD